jgi:NADH:ubiquinone oxidoreductase subunit C
MMTYNSYLTLKMNTITNLTLKMNIITNLTLDKYFSYLSLNYGIILTGDTVISDADIGVYAKVGELSSVLLDLTAVDTTPSTTFFQYTTVEVLENLNNYSKSKRYLHILLSSHLESTLTSSNLYKSAEALERESFDMLGIRYQGHSNLRRILTDYGFLGNPLKKSFALSGLFQILWQVTSSFSYITNKDPVKMFQYLRMSHRMSLFTTRKKLKLVPRRVNCSSSSMPGSGDGDGDGTEDDEMVNLIRNINEFRQYALCAFNIDLEEDSWILKKTLGSIGYYQTCNMFLNLVTLSIVSSTNSSWRDFILEDTPLNQHRLDNINQIIALCQKIITSGDYFSELIFYINHTYTPRRMSDTKYMELRRKCIVSMLMLYTKLKY